MAISLEDQRAYKTACLQAAATLLAHHRGVQADECLMARAVAAHSAVRPGCYQDSGNRLPRV